MLSCRIGLVEDTYLVGQFSILIFENWTWRILIKIAIASNRDFHSTSELNLKDLMKDWIPVDSLLLFQERERS